MTERKQRVKKPDAIQHKKVISKISEDIDKLKNRLNQIEDLINSGGNDQNNARKQQIKKRLDEIRKIQAENKKFKANLFKELEECNADFKQQLSELKAEQRSTPFKSLSDIDKKMRELEKEIESGQCSIVEEKKNLNEISKLKKSKAGFKNLDDKQAKLEKTKVKLDKIREQIDDAKMKQINDEYNKLQQELNELMGTEKEKKERDELFEKRTLLNKELYELKGKRKQQYEKNQKEYDDYKLFLEENKERQLLEDKLKVEEDKANELNLKKQELMDVASKPAFDDELIVCDMLLNYFQTDSSKVEDHLNEKVSNLGGKLEERKPEEGIIPKGITLKKKEKGMESYFSAKKVVKNNNKVKASTNSDTGLKLPLAIMDAFWKLELKPPTLNSQIPSTLKEIEDKKSWYKDNSDRVTKERVKEAELKIKDLTL